MTPSLSIFDPSIFRYLDVFKCIMLREHSNTLLPDLVEALGPEILPKFLSLFAGATFRVPSPEVLQLAARDAEIYSQVHKRKVPVEIIARRYDLSLAETMAICERVGRAVLEVTGG